MSLTAHGLETLSGALSLWAQAQFVVVGRLGRKRWVRMLRDLSATISLVQGG